jgi:ribonuclease D
MANKVHDGDLPDGLKWGPIVAIDTEAMGLDPHRDRLCVAQLSNGDGHCHLVRFAPGRYEAPRLKALLADPGTLKLFHFARFDMAMFKRHLGVEVGPIYCTKIASRLARTYTDRHGLKDLCRELLNIDISKIQQSSDWGAETLSAEQVEYAATDVRHLHAIKAKLDAMLAREGRTALAERCFAFLPTRVALDLAGWPADDVFAH